MSKYIFTHVDKTVLDLSNGKAVKLPMDQGEGQHWNISPKNIYSKPVKLNFKKV